MNHSQYPDLAGEVKTSTGDHPIWVGWGILEEVGTRVKSLMSPSAAYVIADEKAHSYASKTQISMEAVGIPTHIYKIASGETSKNLETVRQVYTWLAERKAERGHLILAVGGGVVGDLVGFVAATYLRGIPFVQIPTTLLAMMDASIGGKVAVDMPQGKNLVGAFYQPKFVLSDVETLKTLPVRELTSGWAEAIKHGLILDDGLLDTFESHVSELKSLDPEIATETIRRSVAIKAGVVSQDEKETLGIRILLNYGHTIGHAIESITGYTEYLHGEAVSVGMMGAAKIGELLQIMDVDDVERQKEVLQAYGLPISAPGLNSEAIISAMTSDKKTTGGSINWVLLDGIGKAITNNEVPDKYVSKALKFVLTSSEHNSLGGVC
ncbi:MAG: 3-dehydroquinate synthase [SAR202 cluster bacterium Io17-Chloro-G3]|nr:MAG: 3-dehydroquinate synthase [SAR202 cluster bacterium Io17-Chloro-G3]